MSIARTYPSLRTRIIEQQRGITTLPTGVSGINKPQTQSFTERYRGTEYDRHVAPAVVSQPAVSRGRMFWIVTGSAATVVIGIVFAAAPA